MSIMQAIKEAVKDELDGINENTVYEDNPYDAMGELNAVYGMVDYF